MLGAKGASQAAGGPGATPESAPEIPTMEAMAMTSLTPKSAALKFLEFACDNRWH